MTEEELEAVSEPLELYLKWAHRSVLKELALERNPQELVRLQAQCEVLNGLIGKANAIRNEMEEINGN